MSNILKESMKNNIIKLGEFGWSKRRISRELGVHRNTVKKYILEASKCTIPTAGDSEGTESKCTISTAGNSGRKSICEKYDEVIRGKLADGLNAQRIYQDLCAESGFGGSYEAVKRYVRKLRRTAEMPFRRMEKLPGEECQVDYGTGAWVTGVDGKRRKTHLFRMTLSYSRKAYSEVSYSQSTENFLRAMENGFRFFGGVTDTVMIDNLKAGVIRSDFYDPDLNPKLRDFAEHYGTCIMPTRVYTPRHKGKVERSVGYVQDNALKKREFRSLDEQNTFLREWETGVADQRIHGTVRRQVRAMFEDEKAHLKKLPADLFPSFCEQKRKVHRDAHVEVEKAYYSVPPEYIRREVWVRFDGRTVRVFNLRMEQITIHARKEPGRFSTRNEHIPQEKISNPERGNEWMLRKAGRIGNEAQAWSRAMLRNRGIPGTRVLNGLLSLTRRHPASSINRGCRRALKAGVFTMQGLKKHIAAADGEEQTEFEFTKTHPLIRGMEAYEQNLKTKELF
jgi:transposase